MAQAITLEMDSKNLDRAILTLSRMTGRDLSDVIEHETIKVLETAMSRQKAARVKDIQTYYKNRKFGMYKPSFQPKRPFKGKLSKGGFKRYYFLNFYPDALWNEIQNQNSDHFATAKKARGLLKKAWAQIGADLGLIVKVPGYVSNATTKKGDYPEDTSARRSSPGKAFYIEGTNARPYGLSSRSSALGSAMRGRAKLFATTLSKGVLNQSAAIARAYPGLVVGRS